MKLYHCNEEGIRFESVTVPAAVMPDRFNDDGFPKYLPLSGSIRMGRLQKTGISQKTCHTNIYSTLSGKKAQDHTLIPYFDFPSGTEYQMC